MRKINLIILLILCSCFANSYAQEVINQVSDIAGVDTCCIDMHIGEIYYFGKNQKKAQLYPHFSCIIGEDKGCEIIWVPSKSYKKRAKISEKQLKNYVYGNGDSKFSEFPCFAFIQKYNVQKFEDGIIYGPKFPTTVQVYSYKDCKWIKLFEREVNSNEDLGNLQLQLVN